MIIATKPGYVEVSYDEVNRVIIFKWTNFTISLEDIQELHQKALDTAQQHNCFYFIAETSQVRTALPREIIEWWGQTWVPKLVQAGLQAVVTVVPTDVIAGLSTKSWQTQVVDGVTMRNVQTFEEAIATIYEIRENNVSR